MSVLLRDSMELLWMIVLWLPWWAQVLLVLSMLYWLRKVMRSCRRSLRFYWRTHRYMGVSGITGYWLGYALGMGRRILVAGVVALVRAILLSLGMIGLVGRWLWWSIRWLWHWFWVLWYWVEAKDYLEPGYVYLARRGDLLKIGATKDWYRRARELGRDGWLFIDVVEFDSVDKAFLREARVKEYLRRRCLTLGKVYHGPGGSEVWFSGEWNPRDLTAVSRAL